LIGVKLGCARDFLRQRESRLEFMLKRGDMFELIDGEDFSKRRGACKVGWLRWRFTRSEGWTDMVDVSNGVQDYLV